MRAIRVGRGLLAAAILCGLLPVGADARGRNVSISTEGNSPRSCADLRIRFDEREGFRAEEAVAVPSPGRDALRLSLPESSGAWVQGGEEDGYTVRACKAAARSEDLSRITVSYDGGRLAAAGPGNDGWAVHFLIRAPRGARLDLEADHGPIGVSDVAGEIRARNQNGPLSFKRCSGSVQAETENGPISLANVSGDVTARAVNGPIAMTGQGGRARLEARNGPVAIRLQGKHWEGDLEASTVNGPLTLRIPDNYRSGVRVDIQGNGPVSCPETACDRARRTSDAGSQRIELGEGENVVRLSVVNGPVSIRSGEPSKDGERIP